MFRSVTTSLPVLALGFLWFRLIDHVRVEWTVNEQYNYGWAVPFLALYLVWKGMLRDRAPWSVPTSATSGSISASRKGREGRQGTQAFLPSNFWFGALLQSTLNRLLLLFLCFLYFPTRLIQEANPEWRLVSWALAIIVVGLTLAYVYARDCGLQTTDCRHEGVRREPARTGLRALPTRLQALPPSAFVFPLLFFLVAVPWPTVIEGPLIQGLTRANAGVTVELVNLLGIPAMQHGNVIEVGTGVVGIDEACSGIRSFQATLMIALFLGELYRLTVKRRVGLVLAGFGLSFLFNVVRTTLLTTVAARQGAEAIAKWHDPAGVTILVGCFLGLWAVAEFFRKRQGVLQKQTKQTKGLTAEDAPTPSSLPRPESPVEQEATEAAEGKTLFALLASVESHPQPFAASKPDEGGSITSPSQLLSSLGSSEEDQRRRSNSQLAASSPRSMVSKLPVALAVWLLFVEVAVEGWYRWHEHRLPPPVTWSVQLPRDNPTFRELPFSAKTRQFLRYDEGLNGAWEEPDGARVQAIFLRWNPGKTAVHLSKSHTPEVCMTAAGREMVEKGEFSVSVFQTNSVSVAETPKHRNTETLVLPFQYYRFSDPRGSVHVFYCLWEDRAAEQGFDKMSLTRGARLAPVLAGRRHAGQRSLEIAIWGVAAREAAEDRLRGTLERVLGTGRKAEIGKAAAFAELRRARESRKPRCFGASVFRSDSVSVFRNCGISVFQCFSFTVVRWFGVSEFRCFSFSVNGYAVRKKGLGPMNKVDRFDDLEVYQAAVVLQRGIFDHSKRWPRNEDYSLTDQIRRSSRSVGANLAEAWAKRRYPAHFLSKLTDADGELQETLHWLMTARDCGYVVPSDLVALTSQLESVGRRLGSMINNHQSFCFGSHQSTEAPKH